MVQRWTVKIYFPFHSPLKSKWLYQPWSNMIPLLCALALVNTQIHLVQTKHIQFHDFIRWIWLDASTGFTFPPNTELIPVIQEQRTIQPPRRHFLRGNTGAKALSNWFKLVMSDCTRLFELMANPEITKPWFGAVKSPLSHHENDVPFTCNEQYWKTNHHN